MVKLYYYIHVAGGEQKFLEAITPGPNQLLSGGREIPLPSLQGPAVDFPDDEIRAGADVFDQSLAWLRGRFPGLPVTVVYVPAPLSVYRHAGATVYYMSQPVPGNPPARIGEVPVAAVGRNSDLICNLIQDASVRQGADFLDTRPQLREAAASRPIHGPRDWSHFNETGYRLLGELVAAALQARSQTGCR